MNDYIEYALVEVDPAHLAAVEAVEMDAKDRHVLAAALSADADILLTDNTRDFPAQWMAGQGIELLTAGKPEDDILAALEATAGKNAADAIRKITLPSA